jgi:hypothetical protein
MSKDNPASIDKRYNAPHKGRKSGEEYYEYVRGILRKYLPRLKRELERRYGDLLDRWLDVGGLTDAAWTAEDGFQVSSISIKSLLKETIEKAVKKEQIELSIAEESTWTPLKIEYLLEYIYERCVEEN